MKQKSFMAIFLIIILATLACGINFQLPSDIKTGPTQTEEMQVPLPDTGGPINLTLSFGAGEIELDSGATGALINGAIRYNVADFKPEVTIEGDNVYIEQGDLNISGIPNFEDRVVNEWNFKLTSEPINLSIKAGAYKGRYDLGGLSLNRLTVADGAADVEMRFTEANLIEMKTFDYSTGTSSVELEGLGYGNISTMTFRSGAGNYRLDFSGPLQRDLEALVESGISNVVIIIPAGVPAEVRFEGGLTNVNLFGVWERDGSIYSQPGEGYNIEIRVKMGAGGLELRNK
jgi:hypothetical protein